MGHSKLYAAVAEVIHERVDVADMREPSAASVRMDELQALAEGLCVMFLANNVRFRRDVFMAACGLTTNEPEEAAALPKPLGFQGSSDPTASVSRAIRDQEGSK